MGVQSWKEGHTLSIYYAPGTVQGIAHYIVLCFFIFKINIFLYSQCLIFLYTLYVETKEENNCNDLSRMDHTLQFAKQVGIYQPTCSKQTRVVGRTTIIIPHSLIRGMKVEGCCFLGLHI